MSICLFCKTKGVFHTKEHIIPESLGNDEDILENTICEKCQNYFGREIEQKALEKTNLAFWRTYLGISTKRKRLPSVNLDPPVKGAIPSVHPLTKFGVGFTAHQDGTTSLDIDNPRLLNQEILGKCQYQLVLSPWHLSILGRFLGKIGLEYVATKSIDNALSSKYDQIRRFTRFGSTGKLWPVYFGNLGKISELKGSILRDKQGEYQEIECYRYSLGEMYTGDTVFSFKIGTDVMLICLTNDLPNPDFEKCINGVNMSCIFYADGSW